MVIELMLLMYLFDKFEFDVVEEELNLYNYHLNKMIMISQYQEETFHIF